EVAPGVVAESRDDGPVVGEDAERLDPRRGIPNVDDRVRAGRGQASAVRTERHGLRQAVVAPQVQKDPAGSEILDRDAPETRRPGQAPVRAKRQAKIAPALACWRTGGASFR